MKAFFTTQELSKILNVSTSMLDKLAMKNADKTHPLYINFFSNGGYRLYNTTAIKTKLIELGTDEKTAEKILSQFDFQTRQKKEKINKGKK